MMKKTSYYMSLLLLLSISFNLSAQCPAILSIVTNNNIPANCPSSGSIRVAANSAAGTLNYILTSGPEGAALNMPQDDSTFIGLPAGTYKVKAYCKADPSISDSTSFTIQNNYTPFDNEIITMTPSCNNNGAVTINNVVGGQLPLEYALSPEATFPLGLSPYQSANTFTGLAAGMYIIRVKDGCSEYINKQVEVSGPLPAPKIMIQITNGDPCADNTYGAYVANAWDATTNNGIDLAPYFQNGNGLILNIYDVTGNCEKGALLTTYDPIATGTSNFSVPKRTQYWVESVTSCGQTYGYCPGMNSYPNPFIDIQTTSGGCGTAGSPATMNFICTYDWLARWSDTLTVVVKNSAGTEIAGSPFKVRNAEAFNDALQNLLHDTYTIIVTDACGTTLVNRIFQDITSAGAPNFGILNVYQDCNTEIGTIGVVMRAGGYVVNLSNADSVKIISGPSNVGVNGFAEDKASGAYSWENIIPGAYLFRIYTSCNTTDLPSTISSTPLKRYIRATATSFCTGNGKIVADSIVYNGNGRAKYVLINVSENARVDSNISGTFTNLPTGEYKVAMNISAYCSSNSSASYEIYSNTMSIIQGGSNPQIVKKIAVTCEDASGNLIPTGTLYLNLAGPSPLKLEYIDSSATNPSWVTYTNDAASTEIISGLNASHTYYVRLSGCTGGSSVPVIFGQMTPIAVTNTVQPCINTPYTLGVPEMPGANYQWKNPSGTIISANPNYDIINYNASYDGTYECTVSFAGCVTRTVTTTLNSQVCGLPLPIHLTSFNAINKDCKAELKWTAVYSLTDREFQIERSNDGKLFKNIATLPVSTQANAQYSYTDATDEINKSSLYYRLKMLDMNGTATYSATIMVKTCNNNLVSNADFTVTPNPVSNGHGFNITYMGASFNGYYSIVNTAGQTILKNTVTISTGGTVYVSVPKVVPGVYVVVLTDNNNKVSGRVKVVIY